MLAAMANTTHDRPTIYLVDCDAATRDALSALLGSLDADVCAFVSAEALLAADLDDGPRCLVCEAHLSGIDGVELMERLAGRGDAMATILLSSEGDVPQAVRAIRAGALDYLEKPFVDRVLLSRVRTALAAQVRRI